MHFLFMLCSARRNARSCTLGKRNNPSTNESKSVLLHTPSKIRKYVYFVISNYTYVDWSELIKGPSVAQGLNNTQVCMKGNFCIFTSINELSA